MEETKARFERLYEKFASLFEFAPNGYLVLDSNGAIRDVNQTAAMMLKVPKGKLIGRCIVDFIHEDDRKRFVWLTQICRQEAMARMGEFNMVRDSGDCFTVQIQIQAFPEQEKRDIEFRAALVDVSEKGRLSSSLALLQNVVEIAGRAPSAEQLLLEIMRQIKYYTKCDAVGIRLRDAQGNIPYHVFEGFSRAFCESESPLTLHTDHCLCIEVIKGHTDAHQHYFTANGSFFVNGATRLLATLPPEKFGKTCNACHCFGYESLALVPITAPGTTMGLIHVADRRENKVPLKVVAVLESVGLRIGMALQRFHMQDQLGRSLKELRDLSSHLLKVQEDEQRRIAMELHDQTGQDLTVLKLRVKAIQDKLRKDQPILKEGCAQALSCIDKLIDDVRRMAHGLNPAALESLGLGGALRQMVYEFSQYSRLKINLRMAPLAHISDRNIQTGLFRIIQEALTNTYKHSGATEVTINAIHTAKGLQIMVRDNGRGFEMKSVERTPSDDTSMGLATMRLRARMIGARLTIAAKPGQGTRVKVVLPELKRS